MMAATAVTVVVNILRTLVFATRMASTTEATKRRKVVVAAASGDDACMMIVTTVVILGDDASGNQGEDKHEEPTIMLHSCRCSLLLQNPVAILFCVSQPSASLSKTTGSPSRSTPVQPKAFQ